MGIFKGFLTASCVLALFACSGKDTGTGSDDEKSSGAVSSSGDDVSSSSSAVVIPDGARAATMADIPRVVKFPDMEGRQVQYVFGESGVFSMLFQDKLGTTKMQAVGSYSLDDQGKMTLSKEDCWAATQGIYDSLWNDTHISSTLIFIVAGDTLKAGVTESKLSEVTAGSLTTQPLVANKASQVVGAWELTKTDTSYSFQLYDDLHYVLQTRSKQKTPVISTGIYDIQDGKLITVMEHQNGDVFSALTYKAILKTGKILLTPAIGGKTDTLLSATLPTVIPVSTLLGAWSGDKLNSSNDVTHTFVLEFLDNSVLKLNAYDASSAATSYTDDGLFSIVGNTLVLDLNEGSKCQGDGTLGVVNGEEITCYGEIANIITIKGDSLTFENDFIPTKWGKKID